DIAKVISDLGTFAAVGSLVAVTATVLAIKRHYTEVVTLVTAAALLYGAFHLAKNGIDRPRQDGGLVGVEGSSYPSGHAAYSTIWIGVAVLAARTLPGIARPAALIVASVILAAAIGFSRIYLRVHYWSDVAGGWGLGAGVLAGCA